MNVFPSYVMLAAAALSAGAAQRVIADEPPKSARQRLFERMDADGDGRLSVQEFVGGSLGKAADAKRAEFTSWDLDRDGWLTFEEFRRRGDAPRGRPDAEQLKQQFARLDRNKDGKLTLEELLRGRAPADRSEARMAFYRLDYDEDDEVTLEEFLRRGRDVIVSPLNQFKGRDTDGDGKLSEEEFLRPALGKRYYESAKRNFSRFDLDGDGYLSFDEFRLLPGQKPDAEAMFHGLDVDKDGRLTPDELVRLMGLREAHTAWRTFAEYDTDGDGALSLAEYIAREQEIARARQWQAFLETWGIPTLIAADVLVVAYLGWLINGWWRRRSKPPQVAPARTESPPTRAGTNGQAPKSAPKHIASAAPIRKAPPATPSAPPLELPRSIEEFDVR